MRLGAIPDPSQASQSSDSIGSPQWMHSPEATSGSWLQVWFMCQSFTKVRATSSTTLAHLDFIQVILQLLDPLVGGV